MILGWRLESSHRGAGGFLFLTRGWELEFRTLSSLILCSGSCPRAGFTFPTRDQILFPRRSASGLMLALSSEGLSVNPAPRLRSRWGQCEQRSLLSNPACHCPLLIVCLSTLGRHELEEKTGSYLNAVKTNNRTQRCTVRSLVAFLRRIR